MTVYVKWYGKVLEGELLEGESMGMKQVRIPLDGHHPVALFTPKHVYRSEAEAISATYPTEAPGTAIANIIEAHREIAAKESIGEFAGNMIRLQMIENFKAANWDHERNHLRTDVLNQFYEMWKAMHAPIFKPLMVEDNPEELAEAFTNYDGIVSIPDEAVLPPKPQFIVSDERMAELRTQLKKSLKPVEAKQLTLFD